MDVPIAPPPRPIAELLTELNAADATSRAKAAWVLAGAGDVESGVVQALSRALDDPSDAVREGATWALYHVKNPDVHRERLVEEQPKALMITRPSYPRDAFAAKVQGTVLVDLLISATGKVVHSEVRRSIPALDDAALTCVRGWTFEPAMRGGKPVPVVANAPVAFRIY